jgi:hypothetical protein
MSILALVIAFFQAVAEGFRFASLSLATKTAKDQDVKKQGTDILNAAKKAVSSGDNTSIINLADQLRQPGA